MGSCYSRKANVEKYTYSGSQMASTKLDETSRLARPTPYTRNLSLNSTGGFNLKKGIPPPTKYEHSPLMFNSNQTSDVKIPKNVAPQLQSSIPRYASNIPSISTSESGTNSLDSNCNKSEDLELHVMNNNDISNLLTPGDSSVPYCSIPAKDFKKSSDIKREKNPLGSKSCPDDISSHTKTDDKNISSRIPAKFNAHITGLPRPQLPQYVSKATHILPHHNVDNQPMSKIHSLSYDKLNTEKKTFNIDVLSSDCQNDSDIQTSHITSSGDSHDSITDIDSGLGNSFIEKNKQEDADTLKDLEHLETYDGSPINTNTLEKQESSSCNKVLNRIKDMKIEDKISLRSPMYKREPNGKWIVDDKHFDFMQKYIKMGTEKNSKSESPSYYSGSKTLHKLNIGEHSFSTYASYKGLVSYKRQSPFKYFETQNSLKGKFDKSGQNFYNNVSNIPIVRRPKKTDSNYSKGMFNTSTNKSDKGIHNLKLTQKSSFKIEYPAESVQSSPESSDDKSDSLGNGIGSPGSELENREFLIDDEISDQPGLISFENSKMVSSVIPSLQQTVTELHALQAVSSAKKRSDSIGSYSSRILRDRSGTENRDSLILSSEMGSSCSSIASDDLMLDYEKTFDNVSDGTTNEGSPRVLGKQFEIDDSEDKIFPLRHEWKSNADHEEKNKKWIHRRSSGPFYGGSSVVSPSGKMDWRLRSVSLPLRPPRQMTVREDEDGSVKLDSSSYRLLCQDLNGVKTLLFRLKTVLQEAETLNPFDQANPTNIFYHNLAHSDFPSGSVFLPDGKEGEVESHNSLMLTQENVDLRRQLVLLQQQLEEKDHTIHLLQQQMTKYTNLNGTDSGNGCTINAATQTERIRSLTGSLTNSLSADDSSETLVSVQDAFEEHFNETFKEQDKFRHQMEEITQSLSNLNQNLRVTASRHLCLQNRSFSSFELSCYRNSS